MEKNKRIKNSIIVSFISSTFTLVLLLLLLYFFVWPNITDISLIKQGLNSDYSSYKNITTAWISYNDFKSIILQNKDTKDDLYLKYLLNSTWSTSIYNNSIINTDSSINFDLSLTKKSKIIDSKKAANEQKIEKINKILPIYSWNNTDSNDWSVISDFMLINKIESLFQTFELKYWNSISIEDIVPINSTSTGWSLESDIFKIPMNLKITWNKVNIKNFIHYLENVWNLSWSLFNIDSNLEIYNDNEIKTVSNFKVAMYNDNVEVLDWNKLLNSNSNYNIYNNQVVNIANIKVSDEFLDDNISLIKDIDLEIEIVFYVRGLPLYKVQNFIINFISDYKKLSQEVNNELKKVWTKDPKFDKLNKINDYLKNLDSEINSIEKNVKLSKDNISINNSYKKVVEYNNNLKNIKIKFYNIKSIK